MGSTPTQKDFRHVRKATVLKDSTGDTLRVGGYRPDKKVATPRNFRLVQNKSFLRSSIYALL